MGGARLIFVWNSLEAFDHAHCYPSGDQSAMERSNHIGFVNIEKKIIIGTTSVEKCDAKSLFREKR